MIKVTNSKELKAAITQSGNEPVQFPNNTNILLGTELDEVAINELEALGREAGRSVHLCFTR